MHFVDKKRAKQIIDDFPKRKILVIGDVMLDKYLWGNVERISPEAPVPVFEVQRETVNLGGACNVANNISALDAKAYIIGVIGKDINGKILKQLLREKGIESILVEDSERPTTIKTRVIAVSQQLIRIDRESKVKLSVEIEKEILHKIDSVIDKVDAVIVSDYGKGVITQKVMDKLLSSGKMIFVDPKPSNCHLYKNVTIMTPNKKEAYQCAKTDQDSNVEVVGKKIMEYLNINQLLITLGAEGMALFEGENTYFIKARAKKVFDVTGAGDTVIAVLTLSKTSGADWKESACIANFAAGYVVGEIGTATVDRNTLLSLIPD
ncbi:MAG: D-glycero-beta-D-manno-heptose-7-phosphate kinase [Aquificae bacterium]|nr:D-glycero-beta-D-manno-heptose-7-phosphate kinase [Aquificota bacterium]